MSGAEAAQKTGCCVPMFACFKKTDCYKDLDVNKDGVVDFKDLEATAKYAADALKIDPEMAMKKLNDFCSKINKVLEFLRAAEILFADDNETLKTIQDAIKVIEMFNLIKSAVFDTAENLKKVALNINNVGETISDMQETSISIQAYLLYFQEAGIKIGFNGTEFKAVDNALAKVKKAQLLWATLAKSTSSPALTPT